LSHEDHPEHNRKLNEMNDTVAKWVRDKRVYWDRRDQRLEKHGRTIEDVRKLQK
jgi:hypothetical protein